MLKRKYTKHDYISDLYKKVRFWKSISKSENYGMKPGNISDQPVSSLQKTKEEALAFLQKFCQTESQLLNESLEIQKLYNSLEELSNQADKFQREDMAKLIQHSWTVNNYKFDYYLMLVELFKKEQEIQNKRIKDIKAYIAYTQKQMDLEKDRLKNERNNNKYPASLLERLFSSARSVVFKFSNPRYHYLEKIKKKEEKEIKDIGLDLQKKAKEILQSAEKEFTPESQKVLIKSLKEIKKLLKEGNLRVGYLKSKLFEFKHTLSLIKQKKNSPVIPKTNITEKSKEEKIQDAFASALEKNQNLILVGKHRSLGLTNAVVQNIVDDDEYQEDIIEHIEGLLSTPQGQDFGRSGNSRWKPVQGSNVLYELSVNPKTGHRQTTPRLYAKKELFIQNESSMELTNTQAKKKQETVWVLVRKGCKRTQENDIDLAEKVYFENDGKQHDGHVVVNNLSWEKVVVDPPFDVPQKVILQNGGRG